MSQVTIYTDGACSGNPGAGGWACLLRAVINGRPAKRELVGGQVEATNNEMELTAVLVGLRALKGDQHDITIVTDSQNVIGWLSLGWKRKAPRLHTLLAQIDDLLIQHRVAFRKVQAHTGDPDNERVDQLAAAQAAHYAARRSQ